MILNSCVSQVQRERERERGGGGGGERERERENKQWKRGGNCLAMPPCDDATLSSVVEYSTVQLK